MTAETQDAGIAVFDILERRSGGLEGRALAVHDLESAVEGVIAEFEYDEGPEAAELVKRAREMNDFLKRLSMNMDTAELTFFRECSRCSGQGATAGEDPCIDCDGRGAIHAEEADD